MKYKLNRNVTIEECDWLKRDMEKGEIVFSFGGCTYGCVSPNGIACTEVKNETPFFELPEDCLTLEES